MKEYKKLYPRLKEGDYFALVEIRNRHQKAFVRFIESRYQFRQDQIEDAFTDALIVLLNNVQYGKLGEKLSSSLKTYLFSVGRFLLLQEHRKRKEFIFDNLDHYFPEGSVDPYTDDESSLELDQLKASFKKLSPPCQELLRKYYYQGYSYEEIVESLDYASIESARSQRYNCMQTLKKLIKKEL